MNLSLVTMSRRCCTTTVQC